MGFLESFNRGLSGNDGYEFADRQVACAHCGGTAFDERSAQLNTMGLTVLDLDWANRSATVLVCKDCGHLEWFL